MLGKRKLVARTAYIEAGEVGQLEQCISPNAQKRRRPGGSAFR